MLRRYAVCVIAAAGLFGAESTPIQKAHSLVVQKKYDEAITILEDAHHKKATPELTKALAETYMGRGDYYMQNDGIPPRQKYPEALRSYRKVLQYDKTNKKAQANISTIEGIYKSMGRPVPQ